MASGCGDGLEAVENDATTTKAHPSRARKIKRRIITCGSTKELQRAVSEIVHPGDFVAEIGSQLRGVSSQICQSLKGEGRAVLVDIQRRFPKRIQDSTRTKSMRRPGEEREFYNDVATFCEIPELDDWRQALGAQGVNYTVFVLDVNTAVGNDLEWTALSIAREFLALYSSCELVICKSVGLNQIAARLVHGQKWTGSNDLISPPHIVATRGVQEYRSTIPVTVRPGDAVLEVGCHFGTSTVLLNAAAATTNQEEEDGARGYCIGVDVGASIIKEAYKKYPDLYFSVGDAWKTAELLRIQQEYHKTLGTSATTTREIGFDCVYVDVGGLSGSDGLSESLMLLTSIMHALEPRCIVIKSLCMQRFSSMITPFWKLQRDSKLKHDVHNSTKTDSLSVRDDHP